MSWSLRSFVVVSVVVSAGCSAPGREVGAPEISGEYRAALIEAPCANEDEDTASARRAFARVRALAGLSMPRCDQAASAAARAHCAYVDENGGELTHVEQPGRGGYSGTSFEDRLAAASFADAPAGEVMTTMLGSASIMSDRGYLNSVYHRAFFLRAETISFGYGGTVGCSTIEFGRARNGAVPDVMVVWPPDGATAAPYAFHASKETPNPVPEIAIAGAPVSLITSNPIVSVTASLTGPAGEVAATMLTHQNDPNHLVRQGEVHLIPRAPLAPNTQYRARFVITTPGQPAEQAIETRFTTVAQ